MRLPPKQRQLLRLSECRRSRTARHERRDVCSLARNPEYLVTVPSHVLPRCRDVEHLHAAAPSMPVRDGAGTRTNVHSSTGARHVRIATSKYCWCIASII